MPSDVIVYDIETKESFQEIGTRDPKKLTVSMIGAYSYDRDELRTFAEDEFTEFWRWLEGAKLIVGFNSHGFDNLVISSIYPEILKIPSFDILESVHRSLGFRVKLDSIAQATLGTAKSGDGLRAIELYRQGNIDELRSYCADDVIITRDVYEHGKRNGELQYKDFTGPKRFAVDFTPPPQPEDALLNLSLF
jgi:DEAD/DEAH box helicase domain-containing protein